MACGLCHAEEKKDTGHKEPAEESEAWNRVYDGLAEHIENAENFRKSAYGFVAVGETHYVPDNKLPEIRPFYAMEIHSPKTRFQYAAYVEINLPREGHPLGFRRCSERVQCDDKVFYAGGLTTSPNRKWLKPEEGEEPELGKRDLRYKSYFNLRRLFPFTAATGLGSGVLSKRDQLAASHLHIMRWQEIQSAEEGVNGSLRSEWKMDSEFGDLRMTLLQKKTAKDMPVEIIFERNGETTTHNRLTWKDQEGRLLPDEIESASVQFSAGSRIVRTVHAKINWLPKAELTKYVDCSGRTIRVALCQRFDLPYSVPGIRAEAWDSEKMLAGTQWEKR